MNKHIAILAGDGIGPEVMACAIEVLKVIAKKFSYNFDYTYALVGGAAYDSYQDHLPAETISICKNAHAILFGSVGGPINLSHETKWANCEANSILKLRQAFAFNINLRRMILHPSLANISPLKNSLIQNGLDIIIFRELLGDVYFGEHYLGTKDNQYYARDVGEYTDNQVRSIAHMAFACAAGRNKKLVSVDKANVLATSKLWRQVVSDVAQEHQEIEFSNMLVDNCAMQIIRNPKQFDVILASNLFGDILSDELSVLSGSLGMMPSASFNSHGFGLYEPAGGSAPDLAGKDIANPIAQILSAAMMLEYSFKLPQAAQLINQAVWQTLANGYRTADLKANDNTENIVGTQEFTQQIIRCL